MLDSSVLLLAAVLPQAASAAAASAAIDARRPMRPQRAQKSGFENMGKLDSEMCARLVRQQCYAPAMCGDVLMHDGQANAAAADHIGRLAFAPEKRLKNSLAIGWRYANALVLNVYAHQTRLLAQFQPDHA